MGTIRFRLDERIPAIRFVALGESQWRIVPHRRSGPSISSAIPHARRPSSRTCR
jgi:hypothetical protein